MMKYKRLLLLPPVFVALAGFFLGLRFGYPYHRLIAFGLLMLAWIPLLVSYLQNRQLVRAGKQRLKASVRPYRAHMVVAVMLAVAFYVCWVLFPVKKSPLAELEPAEIRQEITLDLQSYQMLRNAADDIVARFQEKKWLERDVKTLSEAERAALRALWHEGIHVFLEFDLLKEKYSGFYQIDYVAEPALHADAFFLAYATYITQYERALDVYQMVGDNEFMETLLNEPGKGIHEQAFLNLKKRLTHPRVMLRRNAGTFYYQLVKNDITVDRPLVEDFEQRHASFFKKVLSKPELYIENPLDLLERWAFESWFPLQKQVAVQMGAAGLPDFT